MKKFYLFILCMNCILTNAQVNPYILLDHFNRNDSIRPAYPSSGGTAWWQEVENGLGCSVLQTVRIKNNVLEISGCDLSNSNCAFVSTHTANMNMTGKYPTVFSSASSTMVWCFNMSQSRTDPNGFASGQYGAAFVIGANTNDPLATVKSGYAIVFGESGTADPIRLVSYNGNVFNSTTFTNILSVASPATKTNWMSIKVTYNPCNNEWSLTVRDDGISVSDPTTVTGIGATAVNTTFTATNLNFMGMVCNHGSTCSTVRFDNVYIPTAKAKTGTYTWTGLDGNDFQSVYSWLPARQCPELTDILQFNSSSPVSTIVNNIPNQSIAQFHISGNRTVRIRDLAADGIPSTFNITGSTAVDFSVATGSTLILDAASNDSQDGMVLIVGSGATADISGSVIFDSQFSTDQSHQFLGTDAGSVTVNAGGIVRANYLVNHPFGSSLPQQTIVFNSGAFYECYRGKNPFALAAPQSKIIFNPGSTYRHYASDTPSFAGRIYAHVETYVNTNLTIGSMAKTSIQNLSVINGTFSLTGASNTLPIDIDLLGNLDIQAGAALNYDPLVASVLNFSATSGQQSINNTGTFIAGKELTVRLNSSSVTVPQLRIIKPISLSGNLDLVQGTIHLDADIQLVSNAQRSATIAPITGQISYGTGRFVVERFMAGNQKAWQFLATPTKGQTVKDAWQEGNAAMVPGAAGYGTIISSNLPGSGFDFIGGYAPSMKYFDAIVNNWRGISRTDSALYNAKGYMLFVRGDRTVTSTGMPSNQTILRSRGTVFDAASLLPPVISVNANSFESVGNPFVSAIDFSNDVAVIKSAGLQQVFYLWDPNLGSSSGLGAYQTCIKGTGNDYMIFPGGGSYGPGGTVHNTIQSGQAFFVRASGTAATLGFTEQAKVADQQLVTKPAMRMNGLEIYLRSVEENNPLDAVIFEWNACNNNVLDSKDVFKLMNTGENLGIVKGHSILVAERSGMPEIGDTLKLFIYNLKQQDYQFTCKPVIQTPINTDLYLYDRFLNLHTQIDLVNGTTIDFKISTIPGSFISNRFALVFKRKQKHEALMENYPVFSRINKQK